MRVVVFETPEEKAIGLQYRYPIEPNVLFVFPNTSPGAVFHSRNVREPFDLAFLSYDNTVLYAATIQPEEGIAVAPAGTWTAVEARAGWLGQWRFIQGYRVSLPS
jgi:uncharacterized membrane protein (UPF0127 family)